MNMILNFRCPSMAQYPAVQAVRSQFTQWSRVFLQIGNHGTRNASIVKLKDAGKSGVCGLGFHTHTHTHTHSSQLTNNAKIVEKTHITHPTLLSLLISIQNNTFTTGTCWRQRTCTSTKVPISATSATQIFTARRWETSEKNNIYD